MRKVVEDLHMSLSEKDAEIIKLTMHLTDEKKKFQNVIRNKSQKSLAMGREGSSIGGMNRDSSNSSLMKPQSFVE